MGLCTKVDWCMGTETNNTPMDEASRDIPSSEPIPGFAVLHARGERYLIPRFMLPAAELCLKKQAAGEELQDDSEPRGVSCPS